MSVSENVPVHRLMGVSVSRMQGSVVEQLLAMRAEICRFNADRGLQTAIWYSSGWFMQWHEGPADAVEEAWRRSLADRGQGTHRLIHRSEGAPGLAGRLHLCTAHNRDMPADVARRIHAVERQHQLGWTAEPSEIWQQLSAPCRVEAADPVAVAARASVVAVTSEHTEAVDLVKAIADAQGADITYQRFADCNLSNGDIGAAYVDMAEGTHMTRMQALSRRALGNDMVKLSLRQMQCLVLLLGDRPEPVERLGAAVAALLAGLEIRPAVRLIGTAAACRLAARQLEIVPGLDFDAVETGTPRRTQVEAVLKVVSSLQRSAPPANARRVSEPS